MRPGLTKLFAVLVCAGCIAAAGSRLPLRAAQENLKPPAAARDYWAFKLPVRAAVPMVPDL